MCEEKASLFAALDRLARIPRGTDGSMDATFQSLQRLGVPEAEIGRYLHQYRRIQGLVYPYMTSRDAEAYLAEIKEQLWARLKRQEKSEPKSAAVFQFS